MELDWSEQAPHIRSLFHPWQPGDGYDEETIAAEEARLGVRLPTTLRNFYLAWGKRHDLTQLNHPLLNPKELMLRTDTLIFWVENQAVYEWGVRHEALQEANPPVVSKYFGAVGWQAETELPWTLSYPHMSLFLDDMTYTHAFIPGGAIHGGWTAYNTPALPAHHIAWLEEHWSKANVTSWVFGLETDQPPTLYVRDGQAFWSGSVCCLAARDAEVVDEIAQRLQITWTTRW